MLFQLFMIPIIGLTSVRCFKLTTIDTPASTYRFDIQYFNQNVESSIFSWLHLLVDVRVFHIFVRNNFPPWYS